MGDLVDYAKGTERNDNVVWDQMSTYWAQTGQLSPQQMAGVDGRSMTEREFADLGYAAATYGADWNHDVEPFNDAEWAGVGGMAGAGWQAGNDWWAQASDADPGGAVYSGTRWGYR